MLPAPEAPQQTGMLAMAVTAARPKGEEKRHRVQGKEEEEERNESTRRKWEREKAGRDTKGNKAADRR